MVVPVARVDARKPLRVMWLVSTNTPKFAIDSPVRTLDIEVLWFPVEFFSKYLGFHTSASRRTTTARHLLYC